MEIKIGSSYNLAGYGHCVVVGKNRNGYIVTVWGGIGGDKPYTLRGVKQEQISEKAKRV